MEFSREEHLKRIGFKRGHTPWNKGKKTGIKPMLGKKHTEDSKLRIFGMFLPQSGYPGFGFADQANDSIDDWEGGDLIDATYTPRMGFVSHQNPGIV